MPENTKNNRFMINTYEIIGPPLFPARYQNLLGNHIIAGIGSITLAGTLFLPFTSVFYTDYKTYMLSANIGNIIRIFIKDNLNTINYKYADVKITEKLIHQNYVELGFINFTPNTILADWLNINNVFSYIQILDSVAISGSTTLSGLTDVNIPAPTDNQILTYDNATSKWIAEDPPAPPVQQQAITTLPDDRAAILYKYAATANPQPGEFCVVSAGVLVTDFTTLPISDAQIRFNIQEDVNGNVPVIMPIDSNVGKKSTRYKFVSQNKTSGTMIISIGAADPSLVVTYPNPPTDNWIGVSGPTFGDNWVTAIIDATGGISPLIITPGDVFVFTENVGHELNTLTNVNTDGVLDNYILKFDFGTGSWITAPLNLDTLTDVTTTAPAPKQVLYYSKGGQWINSKITWLNGDIDNEPIDLPQQNSVNNAVDPSPNDDDTVLPYGYTNGSVFINSASNPQRAFMCVDATPGAAVWRLITPQPRSYAIQHWDDNATASGIGGINNIYKIQGTATNGIEGGGDITVSSPNTYTFIGLVKKYFNFVFTLTPIVTSNDRTLHFYLYLNPTADTNPNIAGRVGGSRVVSITRTAINDTESVTGQCLVQMNTNDVVSLFVVNVENNDVITIVDYRVKMTELID